MVSVKGLLSLRALQQLDWREFGQQLWRGVLLPLSTGLLVTAVLLFCLHYVYRWHVLYRNKSNHTSTETFARAITLHQQALTSYRQEIFQKQRQRSKQQRHQKQPFQRSIDLLRRSIATDPNHYSPAYWSLAAIYLYHEPRNPVAALDVLNKAAAAPFLDDDDYTVATTKTTMELLRTDAEAIASGHVHMIQDVLRQDAFLSPLAVATYAAATAAVLPKKQKQN
jgi:hypothetical protein